MIDGKPKKCIGKEDMRNEDSPTPIARDIRRSRITIGKN